MEQIQARIHYIKDIDRTVLIAKGKSKVAQMLFADFLRRYTNSLHKNILCSPGRKNSKLIFEIIKTRFAGMYWGSCDLKNAYFNVDNHKLIRELKRIGFPEYTSSYLGLKNLRIVNYNKPTRGLPQGFNTSQYLFNLYMNPIITKMNRSSRWRMFIYVDDVFWCAKTRKHARECRRIFKNLLKSYGYFGRKLELSNKETKRTYIAGPYDEFRALGFVFEPVRSV